MVNETLGQVLAQQNPAPFVDFLTSNYFIVIILLGVFLVIMLPFTIAGISRLNNWYQNTFIRVKKGYIKIKQKLPNDNIRTFYTIPTGKFINFRTYDKKDLTIPWKNEKGWVGFEGRLLTIILDENNQQINLANKNLKNSISQEEITMGYKNAYETGKLIGSQNLFNNLKLWLIIIAVGTILFGLGSIMVSFQTQGKIDNIHIPTGEELAYGFINATQKIQSGELSNPNEQKKTPTDTGLKIPFVS